jgi:hypothetical protein
MTLLLILVFANIPVYFVFGWLIFGTWGDFFESLRFWITPEVITLFQGEYWDKQWHSMKLVFWLIGCASAVGAEWYLFTQVFHLA